MRALQKFDPALVYSMNHCLQTVCMHLTRLLVDISPHPAVDLAGEGYRGGWGERGRACLEPVLRGREGGEGWLRL